MFAWREWGEGKECMCVRGVDSVLGFGGFGAGELSGRVGY